MTLPIDFERNPLIPAVVQDDESGDVLMVGFMNQLAFERTMETGFVHFWSRSRDRLWKKGETSGHTQEVVSIALNCEENSLLIQVIQNGAVCHTGHRTCYYRQILPDGTLFETSDAVFDPGSVYEHAAPQIERLWYGAYAYLRDHDLSEVSGTSRLLRDGGVPPVDRVADELEELAGVVEGSHIHEGFDADLLLEGSQVLYWIALCGVTSGWSIDSDFDLPGWLSSIDRSASAETLGPNLIATAEVIRNADQASLLTVLGQATRLVAATAASAGIDPQRLIESDLEALRARLYLEDYFASSGA